MHIKIPSTRQTVYRGFSVETQALHYTRSWIAAVTFYSPGAADRATRFCDGEFTTEDQAHTVATLVAQKLIDLQSELP
jgi:hypothetical protein